MAARAESASTSESRSTRQRRSNDRLLEFRKRKEQQAAALLRLQRFVAAGRLQERVRRWLAGRSQATTVAPDKTEGAAGPEGPVPRNTATGLTRPAADKRKIGFDAAASPPKRSTATESAQAEQAAPKKNEGAAEPEPGLQITAGSAPAAATKRKVGFAAAASLPKRSNKTAGAQAGHTWAQVAAAAVSGRPAGEGAEQLHTTKLRGA